MGRQGWWKWDENLNLIRSEFIRDEKQTKFVLGFRIPIFAIIRNNNNNPCKINNDKIINDPNAS